MKKPLFVICDVSAISHIEMTSMPKASRTGSKIMLAKIIPDIDLPVEGIEPAIRFSRAFLQRYWP